MEMESPSFLQDRLSHHVLQAGHDPEKLCIFTNRQLPDTKTGSILIKDGVDIGLEDGQSLLVCHGRTQEQAQKMVGAIWHIQAYLNIFRTCK